MVLEFLLLHSPLQPQFLSFSKHLLSSFFLCSEVPRILLIKPLFFSLKLASVHFFHVQPNIPIDIVESPEHKAYTSHNTPYFCLVWNSFHVFPHISFPLSLLHIQADNPFCVHWLKGMWESRKGREKEVSQCNRNGWQQRQKVWKQTLPVIVGFPTPSTRSSQIRGFSGLEVKRKGGRGSKWGESKCQLVLERRGTLSCVPHRSLGTHIKTSIKKMNEWCVS